MTNVTDSNASSSLSQTQIRGGDIFPRPLREWILKISRRVNSSNEKALPSSQEKKPFS